jgi:hypothetical protein
MGSNVRLSPTVREGDRVEVGKLAVWRQQLPLSHALPWTV